MHLLKQVTLNKSQQYTSKVKVELLHAVMLSAIAPP